MNTLRNYGLVCLLALVAGCQMLGLTQPKSFDDRLQYAYSLHESAVRSTTTSLDARQISSDDAKNVRDIAQRARLVLDSAANAMVGGDLSTAEGRLAMATSILLELQAYLNARAQQ